MLIVFLHQTIFYLIKHQLNLAVKAITLRYVYPLFTSSSTARRVMSVFLNVLNPFVYDK